MEPVMEVMVMEELNEARQTYLYNRGNYNDPSQEVDSNTPSVLPKMDSSLPKNRLGLARWLFQKDNPLTSRVAVNRYWQMLFGNGLVSTPSDFGVQGSLPSHPELLYLYEQSTNCCSDNEINSPVLIALIPSIAAIALNAQQLPH